MTAKTNGATIIRLEVSDFQGLRAAKLEHLPERGLVRITGPNGAGKTTILKAIQGALGGAGLVHERAIRDGAEDGATIDLELSNGLQIRRRHTTANPKGHLTVSTPEGAAYSASQSRLDDLLGPLSFDPQAFFGLGAKRQREILLSIGKDPDLVAKLDKLAADRARLYATRTPWISKQQDARKGVKAKPVGDRPEPVDTSAESAKLRELQAADRAVRDARRIVVGEQAKGERATRDSTAQEARVIALRAELNGAEADLGDMHKDLRRREVALKAAQAAVDAMPDPADAIQACMDRISQAEGVQRALKPWEAWEAAQVTLKDATERVAALTDEMGAMEAEEHGLIAAAGIPVRGVTFDADGSPLLNGRPMELASGGERIELAVDVALAVDPELRICLVDEANDLDLEALDRLHQRAEEHGFQVWVCRIGLEGPGEVSVLAGEAHSREAEPELF
jgi:energy-coupling factor transporter ATP-binding protein EcfA2